MGQLNYKHLFYFWMTAQESGLTRAAQRLHLTPQTICTQLQQLEDTLGVKLLQREGRGLTLTEAGRLAFDYADEIFSLGNEMKEAIRHRVATQPRRFAVGITDYLPKLVAYRLLQPVLALPERVRLHCHEGRMENLAADLASHRLDLILSDRPLAAELPVKAFSHFLGESGLSFLAVDNLAKRHQAGFPASLDGAPLLLASSHSVLRGRLQNWFESQGIHPRVVAEFDDSALMKVFGQGGAGIFCVPTLIETEVLAQFQVGLIGRTTEVTEYFYAISLERRLTHPAVTAIHRMAREALFVEADRSGFDVQ